MRIAVLPDYGSRVVSLVDKANGRDWIFQGGATEDTGEDAVYGADAAVGWDECFPTISPWDASQTMWKRPLRDHGDLWGRPWSVDALDTQSLTTTYATKEFAFTRTLELSGAVLTARYRVENRTSFEMPFLWALHGLLAATPDDRIALPGRSKLSATYVSRGGEAFPTPIIGWPDGARAFGFRLDEVQPESANFAAKFYDEGPVRCAALGREAHWLVIAWREPIKALGIWLNYGGWPNPARGRHIALEPTTAPVDHLGQALDAGEAAWIKAGGETAWTITMTLTRKAP
jgi:galactose mutarotase-like enzyme